MKEERIAELRSLDENWQATGKARLSSALGEALDEIESLRAENERLKSERDAAIGETERYRRWYNVDLGKAMYGADCCKHQCAALTDHMNEHAALAGKVTR